MNTDRINAILHPWPRQNQVALAIWAARESLDAFDGSDQERTTLEATVSIAEKVANGEDADAGEVEALAREAATLANDGDLSPVAENVAYAVADAAYAAGPNGASAKAAQAIYYAGLAIQHAKPDMTQTDFDEALRNRIRDLIQVKTFQTRLTLQAAT